MFDAERKNSQGNYPNIIYKKKLAPLPLFKQNLSPMRSTFETPTKTKSSNFGFNSKSAGLLPLTTKSSTFLNEFKTINNYGRLCDQPFLEFSSHHFEQVFGSGGGKKKVRLDPIQMKKDKKKIQKLYTMALPVSPMGNAIKIEDNTTTSAQAHHDHTENHTRKLHVSQPESAKKLQKVYQIGEYEAVIGYVSLEVVLKPSGQTKDEKLPLSIFLTKSDLKKIYKKTPGELIQTVLDSLIVREGRVEVNIKREEHPQSGRYVGDEAYPEKKEHLSIVINEEKYDVTINFPYLEVVIDKLEYHEKMVLRPMYLANLFEERFDNLQDYVQRFSIPPHVYKDKEELHNDELKSLPPIIKKVIRTDDFGGLMLFKSMEIHLKNTSEMEPQTMMHESMLTPMTKTINRKKKKDVNSVLLRLSIDQLQKVTKCSPEEISELIKESIVVEEGTGFSIRFEKDNIRPFEKRGENAVEEFPELTEKFNIRFNKFLYEVFIKFPTLELYIPETNFKDVIQLTPNQLQDLIKHAFNNMEDYIEAFKKPAATLKEINAPKVTLLVSSRSGENEPFDTLNQVKEVSKALNYALNSIDITEPDDFDQEILEEHIKTLENSEYLIVVCQVKSAIEPAKVNAYINRLQSVNPRLEEVFTRKKIFYILNMEYAPKDEGGISLEKELDKYYQQIFKPLGLVFLKNVCLGEGHCTQEQAAAIIEERLKELHQTLEEKQPARVFDFKEDVEDDIANEKVENVAVTENFEKVNANENVENVVANEHAENEVVKESTEDVGGDQNTEMVVAIDSKENAENTLANEETKNAEAKENANDIVTNKNIDVEPKENIESFETKRNEEKVIADEKSENVEANGKTEEVVVNDNAENVESNRNAEKVETEEKTENIKVTETSGNLIVNENTENATSNYNTENTEVKENTKNTIANEDAENVEAKGSVDDVVVNGHVENEVVKENTEDVVADQNTKKVAVIDSKENTQDVVANGNEEKAIIDERAEIAEANEKTEKVSVKENTDNAQVKENAEVVVTNANTENVVVDKSKENAGDGGAPSDS